jgi:cytidylate kinase
MVEVAHDYNKAISKSAEHQMRQWALGLEVKERIAQEEAVSRLPERIHPYVAISRDAGAGASEVARRVGQRLNWEVLDRELLSNMAEQHNLQKGLLEFVDETTTSWLLEVFGKWLSEKMVTQSEYVTRLGEFVLMAAQHASTIFVGRGAQFLLPRERGVVIQIIAPWDRRVERIMNRLGISRDKAIRHLYTTDQARRDFVKRYFHHDVTDAHLYDLVLNLEHLAIDDAVDLIVGQCQRRFGDACQGRQTKPRS